MRLSQAENARILARQRRSVQLRYIALVLPIVLYLAFFYGYPVLAMLFRSINEPTWTLDNFAEIFRTSVYAHVLWITVQISLVVTVVTLILAYPLAYLLSSISSSRANLLMILVLVPFWTSILVKSYAFTVLLGKEGVVNSILTWAFGEGAQLPLLFNRLGVMVGMTNYLIPFVVFPVLASLLAIDRSVYRAVEIMGAKPATVFWKVTLPLSMPGVLSAVISTFVMSTGFFVIPALLGGRKDVMLANLVDFYTRETLDWNMAAGIGVILLAIVTLIAGTAMQFQKARGQARGV